MGLRLSPRRAAGFRSKRCLHSSVFIGKLPVQPPLSADVRALPDRTSRLHAGLGLGEGPSREPGWIVRERFFTPRLRVASYES